MPAQIGTSITLNSGPQGSRQLGGSVTLDYQTIVTPRVRVSGAGVRAVWAPSAASSSTTTAVSPATAKLERATRAPWTPRKPVHAPKVSAWLIGLPTDRARRAAWVYRGRALQPARVAPWGRALVADHERHAPWGVFERRPFSQWLAAWNLAAATDRARLAPWGNTRAVGGTSVHAPMPASRSVGIVQWIPWVRFSRPLQPGWGIPTPPGPSPDPSGTWIVPALNVYIMQNQVTLVRVSDGQAIPAVGLQLSLDAESWAWRIQATMPASAQSLVESAGDPVELQATINGEPFKWLVESIGRERQFGSERIRISGRSRSALLAAPYAITQQRSNASARTAQQLMGDVLSVNGVPLAWSVEWGLTDWLVPAGAWSHQGSYIDALAAIAQAAGAYLQPHPTDSILRVLHRYPAAPWDWATTTPDYELPAAVVTREGIEWQRRPDYNRVFVSGTTAGVLGQITRAGTAGDIVAPMITEPLATHADAVRQRGLAVLADVGRQARVSLRLPVLEETGVIVPGKLIRYIDGGVTRLGLVRGTQVDAGHLEVWQSLEVETHE